KMVADLWFYHKNRRQYINGVSFEPGRIGSEDGVLNLWCGYGVDVKERKSWDRLKAHILSDICCGNPVYFEYLMNWMAFVIQHPGVPGEVAVVLRRKASAKAFSATL